MKKITIAGVLASLLASAPALADESSATIRAADAALRAGRPQEAYAALARAFKRERSVTLEAALGRAELRLGLAREAVEHLTNALRAVEDTDPAWVDIVMDIASARRSVAALRITTSAPGATIHVDGEPVGESPLDREIFVDEGTHEVRAEGPGVAALRTVHGSMGKAVDVALVLQPTEPDALSSFTPARVAVAPETATLSARRGVLFGGAALSATALAIGGGFAIAAAEGRGNVSDERRDAAAFLVGGSVALGATLTYALWPAVEPPPAKFTIAAGPLGGAATYRW